MQESTLGNYAIGNTLGEGTFGKVKMGTHLQTGEKVAIKILEKAKFEDESDVYRIAKEIEILKKLRHPHIIQIYEIIDTDKEIYLIMEYASGGELFEYIVKNHKVSEKVACRFLLQILSGVEYMHKIGIVHRDLKPENLLFDHNQNIKIVDFGLSNTYKPNELLKTACGSPCYAAPEMIQGLKYSGYLIDIWSCGIVLYAMLCGYLPFEDQNTNQLYKKIIAGELVFPKWLSAEAKDLLKNILNTDPKKRFTIPQIKGHKWAKIIKLEENFGNIGSDNIQVDEIIVEQLKNLYSIDPQLCRKLVKKNRHNNITTLYYLQIQKNKKNRTFNYFKKDFDDSITQSYILNSSNLDSLNTSNNNTSRQKQNTSNGHSPQHRIMTQTNNRQQSPSPQTFKQITKPDSPKTFTIQLKREIVKRAQIRPIIPPMLKPIYQVVNNSISSVGTNGNTPLQTNRKTEDSFSLDKAKPKFINRERAISAISEYTQPNPVKTPQPKIHKGAFNLQCTTNRDPAIFAAELLKVIMQMQIKILQQNDQYDYVCSANLSLKFEISIRQIHNCDGLYLLKSHYISGDWEEYQKTLNRLIQLLNF
ncbi:unnamed protein product (macronuclear) [Paramecium tetraurelia]|uniref:Protein kinase domain-containing protein n=1 Tax=Paramecium tetraurelia TaxID=5888 RepID=A0DC30_PARTE|nr:uncharacterized protein GSPATT00015474001 [Paramecium tetraurelia]CAK80597.1 unnamed protein product [Paramecium tetraurelia]|eukprot:XP_001447994.1 hypothetical protein (macronuclear) [Paramecium tetraurelia strain d4-2]